MSSLRRNGRRTHLNRVQQLDESSNSHVPCLEIATEVSVAVDHTLRPSGHGSDTPPVRCSWTGYVATTVLIAAYLFPFVRVLWHIGDEAISLEGARRVLQGEIPGRDFVEAVGPGAFWWPAVVLKAFGEGIVTAHVLLWVTGIALGLLTFHMARRIGANAYFCAALFTAISIPIWPGYCYHWDSDLFVLLAFTALVEWQTRRPTWLLVGCGLFSAAATLIMQQKGGLLFCAALLSTLMIERRSWRRSFIALLLPYVTVLGSALTFYILRGALGNLLWANYIWPSTRYLGIASTPYGCYFGELLEWTDLTLQAGFSKPVALLLAYFAMLPLAIVIGLPILLLLSAGIIRKRAFIPKLIPFWLCGIALWASELQRADISHLMWGSPILLVLLSYFIRRWRWARPVIGTGLAAIVIFAFLRLSLPMHARAKVETRHGTLNSFESDRALLFLLHNSHPGDSVFIYPYYSLYNFLSDTNNPTRYSYLVYGWNTPGQLQEVISSLQTKRVKYVLWDTVVSGKNLAQWFPSYRDPPWDKQLVERYLKSHYRQIAIENGFRILERYGYD